MHQDGSLDDLLRLTDLEASGRGVRSVTGLQAAHNLTSLNLGGNQLTSLILPTGLTNLTAEGPCPALRQGRRHLLCCVCVVLSSKSGIEKTRSAP